MENESEKKNIKNVFAIKKLLTVGMALGSVVFTKSKTGFPKEEEGAVVEREEQQPIDLDDSKAVAKAAKLATRNAYLNARKNKIPMIMMKDDKLIQIDENGVETIIGENEN